MTNKIYKFGFFLMTIFFIGGIANAYSGSAPNIVVEGDYINQAKNDTLGGVYNNYGDRIFSDGLTVEGEVTIDGQVTMKEATDSTIAAAKTLTAEESGTTFFLDNATGITITLPSVTNNEGTNYKFVISGAATSTNYVIDSAEGDNIEGTLIVAGAVVDCDAEDQINFVVDGENIGDYVELVTDGTQWLIGDSGAKTSAKLTCTDPS